MLLGSIPGTRHILMFERKGIKRMVIRVKAGAKLRYQYGFDVNVYKLPRAIVEKATAEDNSCTYKFIHEGRAYRADWRDVEVSPSCPQ